MQRVQREEQGNPSDIPELPSARKLERSIKSLLVKEEPEFKVDLRIAGIAQDVILEDEERMSQIQKSGGKFTKWIPYQINFWRIQKIHQVQRKIESHNSQNWQHGDVRTGTDVQNRPVPYLFEAHTCGIDLLRLWHLSST